MNTEQQGPEKIMGMSKTTLQEALQAAVGSAEMYEGDILGRYDVVEVRGVVEGKTISSWQVTLKPKSERH